MQQGEEDEDYAAGDEAEEEDGPLAALAALAAPARPTQAATAAIRAMGEAATAAVQALGEARRQHLNKRGAPSAPCSQNEHSTPPHEHSGYCNLSKRRGAATTIDTL